MLAINETEMTIQGVAFKDRQLFEKVHHAFTSSIIGNPFPTAQDVWQMGEYLSE